MPEPTVPPPGSREPAGPAAPAGEDGGGGRRRRKRKRSRGGAGRRPGAAAMGVDFGTDYSALASFGPDGLPHVRPNRAGRALTPSALLFTADGRLAPAGGWEALADGRDGGEDGDAADGSVPLDGFKRMLADGRGTVGRRGAPLLAGATEHAAGVPLTPGLLGAACLRGLADQTAADLPPDAPAVLTVPHAFTSTPRRAILDAGRLAGLNVAGALAETTAAALAWVWRDVNPDGGPVNKTRYALVYDLGAGTFDAALVKARGNDVQVVAAEGDPRLGGRDWTARLADEVARRFEAARGFHPASRSHLRRRLFARCEGAKRQLSDRDRADVFVEANGVREAVAVTRAEFQWLTVDLLERTRDLTEMMLENAGVDPRRVDVVLPAGGAAAMPAARAMLTELCGEAATAPHPAVPDPRTAVAEGAAVYAAMHRANGDGPPPAAAARVRRRLKAVRLHEVSPHSVGVEIDGPGGAANHVLLPRNRPLPAVVHTVFATTLADPQGVRLRLAEGESPAAAECDRLGEFRIVGLPPGLPAGSRVRVSIELDERNAPQVSAARVLPPEEAAAPGRAHDLEPLGVVAVRPQSAVPTDAAARARFRTLLATPR